MKLKSNVKAGCSCLDGCTRCSSRLMQGLCANTCGITDAKPVK